jgi:PAS domain S-box-containing protein
MLEVQDTLEQKEWLRVTLASIGDAVITTDAHGRITFLNATAESLTGWTQEDAVGQPLETVFHIINEKTRRKVESPADKALREGVVVGLANHSLLIARDGTERPIDDSAAPIRDGGGKTAGVVLVFRDITERREAERPVSHALAHAENVIATLREPFLVLDSELRVRLANQSFYQNFRTSKEDTENRLIYELGDGQWDIPGLRRLLEDVLPQNHAFDGFSVEHDFPEIGRRSMLLNARRIRDNEPGELILLAIEDVTERKQAQENLMTSELSYRRLFETARDGILILDFDTGQIVDANPFIGEILGYGREELLGKELWQIGMFNDIEVSRRTYHDLKQKGYVRYEHLPLKSKDGRTVEVEFVSNIYRVDGRRVAQCNIRDISERRRLQREVQQQAEELADAHRRKDEFLAMLSHELRNPLAPIANAAQLLALEKDPNPIQAEACAIIGRQVAHMTRLVDDLLEVSRITTGRLHIDQERVALSGIVDQAVETMRPLIDRRRHKLTVSLPTKPIMLYADAARLTQVVSNLLDNAAKYTEEGGTISLKVRRKGDQAVLRVRDNGIGIAPELLPRVFDLFTQAEKSLARSRGGLGVGLTLVRTLVELHGGKVEARSSGPGKGSEFILCLPVAPSLVSSMLSTAIAAAPVTRSLRVLVVDDNVDLTTVLGMMVRRMGHHASVANGGAEALEAALKHRPDVIFLDIGLPVMDGYEVAKLIREEAVLQNTLLVALTGYGREENVLRSQKAGFDQHLVKPVDFKTIEGILTALAKSRATSASAEGAQP